MRALILLPSAFMLLVLAPPAAWAEPSAICVQCTGPAQSYGCTVAGADAPADRRRLGLYCAARIARDESHSTCAAVRREMQCKGVQRSYVYDGDARLPGTLTGAEPDPAQDPDAQAAEKDGPPETMVELSRETARQTGETLKRAADETAETTRGVGERVRDAAVGAAEAVDRATRNTIKCIGSLFDDC
jgi:hypothetical protein